MHVADAVLPESTQEPLNKPVPLVWRAKVPVGVIAVPLAEVSVTVTVQEEGVPVVTGLVQLTVVVVVLLATVMLKAVGVVLPLWLVSLGTYEPVMLAVPLAEGVKFTLQLATPSVPGVRLQVPEELKLTVAVPEAAKLTLPAGVRAVPARGVSVTVAMQLEAWLMTMGVAQVMDVDVVRRLTAMVAEV